MPRLLGSAGFGPKFRVIPGVALIIICAQFGVCAVIRGGGVFWAPEGGQAAWGPIISFLPLRDPQTQKAGRTFLLCAIIPFLRMCLL